MAAPDQATPRRPWAADVADVARELDVDLASGLGPAEAERRLETHGPNELRRIEPRSAFSILVAQLKSAVVWLLLVAAGLSLAFQDVLEAVAIVGVVAVNTLLGFVTELRASRSMEALRELGAARALVRRGGAPVAVDASGVVPGDLVILEAGDVVTADLRIVESAALAADESALTGESAPVDKQVAPVETSAVLAERASMLFKGTTVVRGSGEAVAVATGAGTELGHIGELVAEAASADTPLERRIERLGRQLMIVSLALAAVVAGLGALRGQELLLMVESAIALAVATVPEGLPVVATLALARGMWRLARHRVLVENLGAVETLGSTSIVITDKTGTLTENRMHVAAFVLAGERVVVAEPPTERSAPLARALRVAVSSSADEAAHGVGEPMDVAMVTAASALGVDREAALRERPRVGEVAFDPTVKMSASEHAHEGGVWIAVKGAPEAVLEASTQVFGPDGLRPLNDAERTRWLEWNRDEAAKGHRLLALAEGRAADLPTAAAEPFRDLVLVALVALMDPARETVAPAIHRARSAGVRFVMATGDQAPTATAIAKAVGLADAPRAIEGWALTDLGDDPPADAERDVLEADVVARAAPEHKLRLLRLHQRRGAVVAMLGDGVNDAPALEQADIGVAMGKRGTAVARQSADMVLQDDDIGSVVVAVEEGRVIFDNLRAFVVYLLGCNLSELLVIGLAAAMAFPLPLLPMQILYLNLVTDVFPAAALGVGQGNGNEMARPPRSVGEPFLTRRHWGAILGHGLVLSAAVLAVFLEVHRESALPEATSAAFATLGLAQVWHVFDMAGSQAPRILNGVTRNRWVWGAVLLCLLLMGAGLFAPGLSHVLGVVPMSGVTLVLVLAGSLAPVVVIQLGQLVLGRLRPKA